MGAGQIFSIGDPRCLHVAFTGTRRGMTTGQKVSVFQLLKSQRKQHSLVAHHGGCHGADLDFHHICQELGIHCVVHPGDDQQRRRFRNGVLITVLPVHSYLVRNRIMVDVSRWVIGCPGESNEQMRSGTWMTIRYARKVKVDLCVVVPNGNIKYRGEEPHGV